MRLRVRVRVSTAEEGERGCMCVRIAVVADSMTPLRARHVHPSPT
jgi:hypothetical protein